MEKKAVGVRLDTLADLIRLASSMVSMGSRVYIVHFAHNSRHYYGLLVTFRDYYKYYGVPLFYYVELDRPLKGNYVLLRADEAGERVEEGRGPRTGWISIPVINLADKPDFLEV